MEYSTSFSSPSPSPPPQKQKQKQQPRATPADLEAVGLRRLSDNLQRLLDPAFLNCADAEIALAAAKGGAAVGVHSCILAARSNFFLNHFTYRPAAGGGGGERYRLELADLIPGGRHIGHDALVPVLGYLYTGRLKLPPQEATVCMDDACGHGTCRPVIDFVVESMYAASGFGISELISFFQLSLSDFVGEALDEDVVPIINVASTCDLQDLLNQCIKRVAVSTLDSWYLEKELPDDIYCRIKEIRRSTFHHESVNAFLPEHEKRVRNILKALDSDDVDLVRLLLNESSVTLDDAYAIHYAAAYSEPKVFAELLKLDCANVNLKNNSGYTPLHIACMRREPGIILSLVERGASILERTLDGRDALTICKRLTRERDCNRKLEKHDEKSKAHLCIDILEQELERKSFILDPISIKESTTTPLFVDNIHMRLINMENRVAFARMFFPSEAKLVMRIAQADSTEEFAGITNFRKVKEVDLNETSTMQNRRLRERFDALTKSVELGRRYFPHCSEVVDKFLNEESTDLIFLETGTPEDQRVKRMRFSELKEDVRKAFTKDKAAVAAIASSASSSSSLRCEGRGRSNRKLRGRSNSKLSKSGNGERIPAGPVGDTKRSFKAEPAGDPQVGVCSASIRWLFQQFVHVQTTMSSFSGKLPSDSWINHIKHLTSDAEGSLEHLHYKMMLAKLEVRAHLKKVMPNVSGTCSKTTATRFMHLLASHELVILSVTDKLEGLRHGSPGLSGAVLGNYSDMLSLSSSVMRCILLCRGILGITNMVNMEDKEGRKLPVFAFDDLTYTGQNKGTGINRHSVPARMTDPIYFLPVFIRSLLCLDLSSCSGLTQLPPSIGNLSNLSALSLSDCYSLHTLPVSVGRLKNLQILVLSCCHELRDLPVSLCELYKLRLLDLAGCSSLENLPASLVNLSNLENLNLSYCKGLKDLPQPFGNLQELKYLNFSGSHRIDLDVECLYTLANLKSLTLSPLTNIQGFPDSFKDLVNRLDSLRWWKKNHIHPQCAPKAASLHSYRCYEQSIIDMLLSDGVDNSSDQIVTYACIVGESGMGKTELVYRIYNHRMILDTFDLRIWLHMCDKKRLLSKIVELTTCASCGDASVSVLEEIVIEELTSKRLLLLLEDSEIKNQYFWGYLRNLLNVCAKGSAVIVTTKSKEVPSQIGAMQTLYLSPLSKEECFMIFKEYVPEELVMNNYCQLESISWKFVEKCGGNPMCIKAVSGLLCHSEVGLSEIDMIPDGILPALRLCYDLLPAHLQQCFKFCSLFPKDYIFDKHHIIRLWIAEGFVLCEEGTKPEDTALHYFDQLCCRSFFQHSPFHSDHKDSFVMHELFHDLADSVSKNECFRCEEPFCSLAENVSHLSLVLSDFKTAVLSNEVRNLQSFLVVRRCFPLVRIYSLDDIFMKHRFLRALNLSYTDILELPISIGNMKHLRLLALNNTKIKSLPIEIGQVNNLQTLELKDCCHLIELPGSTSNLAKLQHLDVQKESGNVNVGMPRGIGHLTDLQTLTTFNIGNDLFHCSISELKNLNGLRRHVHVTGLENIKTDNDAVEANMIGKNLLEALTLEWSYREEDMDDDMGTEIANEILQNLQPNSNIMELAIRNYAGNLFPVWMQDNYLCKLISITLDNCHGCSELPYLGDLPSLKFLFIQRINAVERFGIKTSSLATEEKHPTRFPALEVLNICEMYDLQFWVSTREEDFPRLFHLSISRCPKLTNLPRLISLVHVSFHYGVELPTFSELPSLESLKIEGFQKIRSISFPDQLTTLRKLEIIDCKELLSIYSYSLYLLFLQPISIPKPHGNIFRMN